MGVEGGGGRRWQVDPGRWGGGSEGPERMRWVGCVCVEGRGAGGGRRTRGRRKWTSREEEEVGGVCVCVWKGVAEGGRRAEEEDMRVEMEKVSRIRVSEEGRRARAGAPWRKKGGGEGGGWKRRGGGWVGLGAVT